MAKENYKPSDNEGVIMQKIGELSGKMDRVISTVDELKIDVHKRADRQDSRIDKVENGVDAEAHQRHIDVQELRQEVNKINVDRANQKGKLATLGTFAAALGGIIVYSLESILNKFTG